MRAILKRTGCYFVVLALRVNVPGVSPPDPCLGAKVGPFWGIAPGYITTPWVYACVCSHCFGCRARVRSQVFSMVCAGLGAIALDCYPMQAWGRCFGVFVWLVFLYPPVWVFGGLGGVCRGCGCFHASPLSGPNMEGGWGWAVEEEWPCACPCHLHVVAEVL